MRIEDINRKYHIILASASPRRSGLLSQIGFQFQVMTSGREEAAAGTDPQEIVTSLSKEKAGDVERQYLEALQKTGDMGGQCLQKEREYLIIAADTLVYAGGKVLGKPENEADAGEMLASLQGKTHQVYTGVALYTAHARSVFYECTDVEVAPMTQAQIAEYIASGEPMDKAGAYGIQGRFAAYVKRIGGDYYNVVGLPLARLVQEISAIGGRDDAAGNDYAVGSDYAAGNNHAAVNDCAAGSDHAARHGVCGAGKTGAGAVRLVATDIDGTLVRDSSPEVYPELFQVIRELTDRGVLCCVASGRQYYGIRRMFAEVADDIVYIAENGAHIVYRGKDLSVTNMKSGQVHEIIRQMRSYGKGYEFVVSTPRGSLLESRDESFISLIRDGYRNRMELVEDVLLHDPVIIKCAMHHDGSVRDVAQRELIPAWKDRVKVCMAGEEWVDFMDASVDKGNAIRFVQDYFGIGYEETMTFGDNENDIGMMKAAGESYAVENACESVKKAAKHICPDYTKRGVYRVLSELLTNLKK